VKIDGLEAHRFEAPRLIELEQPEAHAVTLPVAE
jgi:hypothetical protein